MLASLFKKKTTTTIIYNKSFIYGFFFRLKIFQNLNKIYHYTHTHTYTHANTFTPI
jgi:hypothetical protein